ncbi:MAG: hypothetical protein JW807_13765 [Spirochaetes bacterium]|nr:hypothetical protein [Spirochaetota bacterium]
MINHYKNNTKNLRFSSLIYSIASSSLTVLVIIVLCMSLIVNTYAKDEKTVKLQDAPSATIAERIQPEIGARGSFVMPFGKPEPFLGYGWGAALYFDLVPYAYQVFSLRVGVTSEFMYFKHSTSSTAATLMIFPEYAHIKFSVQLDNGFLIYPKIGCGISIALLDKKEYSFFNVSKNSYDLTAIAGLGIGYNPPAIRSLVVFAEADYKMLFEKVEGHFVTASIGIAYKYTK